MYISYLFIPNYDQQIIELLLLDDSRLDLETSRLQFKEGIEI